MVLGKKSDVEITRPLKHRPGVLLIKQNGSQKVIGDGDPFTYQEYIELRGGYVDSTTPRLQLTDEEQAEIDQANARLERASALVDQLYAEGAGLSEKVRKAVSTSNDPYVERRPTDKELDTIRNLEATAHELTGRINEASELEKSALVERNAIQQRITVAARARQFPPTFHNPKLSTDERLANLEERK